jgi:hypothetical protein
MEEILNEFLIIIITVIENAAFSLTNCVLKSVKQMVHVGGIFCDLTEPFDHINH